jgi:predicted ATPase/DNA-binding CsgD family transcriptional regulator
MKLSPPSPPDIDIVEASGRRFAAARPCGRAGWQVLLGVADIPVAGRYGAVVGGVALGQAGEVHGFPRLLTSFVGRADEAAQVAGLLGESRMVTVTGPGGVGKTRLAVEVARQAARNFADGAWLTELAAVRDPGLVPAVVAAAMDVLQVPGVPADGSLVAALARRQVLLVLDNCEHVLDAVAELCMALLLGADDIRVLATSREPAGIAGETRYRLRPLPVSGPRTSEEAGVPAALTLFANRARQADPDFSLDGTTEPIVAELVTRLDGMPLAIELAAARVEALGLVPLAGRLASSFRLLTSGDRTAPPRHRSLAATVEWSYRLLGDAEQAVFRRLSAFPGPFTLDAAVAVTGPDAELAVLRLVDCSLLAPPRAGADGRVRYQMLDTLRAFGRDQLAAAGGQDEADAALARYALEVAQQAAAGLETSPGEVAAARWLDAEDATMQQALAWAGKREPVTAVRLATVLTPWWTLRGRTEGYALLSSAVDAAQADGQLWAAAQMALGQLSQINDDTAAMLRHFTAARDLLETHPRSRALAHVTDNLANTLINVDRIPEGVAEARRALDLARAIGYADGEACALLDLGLAAFYTDDLDAAVRWARQSCRIDPAVIPGDTARSCRLLLTILLIEAGDLDAARESNTTVLALAREAGDVPSEAFAVSNLSELELLAGRLTEAWAQLTPAARLARRTGSGLRLLQCLRTGRELCAATGRHTEAVTLEAARMTYQAENGIPPRAPEVRRHEQLLREAAATASEEIVRAAEDRGGAMTLETAIELLLIVTEEALKAPTATPNASRGPATAEAGTGLGQLSDRERELVTLVARGQTDAQIAGELFISVSTVRSHLDRVRDKTGCRRRADLTRLALQARLA